MELGGATISGGPDLLPSGSVETLVDPCGDYVKAIPHVSGGENVTYDIIDSSGHGITEFMLTGATHLVHSTYFEGYYLGSQGVAAITILDEQDEIVCGGHSWIGGCTADRFAKLDSQKTYRAIAANETRSGKSTLHAINETTSYVIKRREIDEYRYVKGDSNIWIDEACAQSLNSPISLDIWQDLVVVAPNFDALAYTCN